MRVAAALAVLLAASTAHAAPARLAPAATTTDDPLRWIDPDAPVVIALDPGELERLGDLVTGLGPEPSIGVALVSLAAVRELGFDPLHVASWRGAGLVDDAPALLQLAAIDAGASDRVYRALSRSGGQWGTHGTASPPLWRSRFIARVRDGERAVATTLAARVLDPVVRVEPTKAAALAALLGADRGDALVKDLLQLEVVAVGAAPTVGGLVFVRRSGALIVVDLIIPFAGDDLEWRRDRAALRTALGRPGRTGAAPAVATALARPGIAAWTSPSGLIRVAQAWRTGEALRRRFGMMALPDLVRGCSRLRSLEQAAIRDVAVGLVVTPRRLALTARFHQRGLGAIAAPNATPLARVTGRELDVRLAVAMAALRKLPRPALFARGWDELRAVTSWCPAGETLALAVGGPELLATWLDDLARALPAAAPVIDAVDGVGLAVDRLAETPGDQLGVLEAELAPAGATAAEAALTAAFGPSTTRTSPRSYRRWGRGPLRAYAIDGERVAIGAGFGRSADARLAASEAATVAPAPLLRASGRGDRILLLLGERLGLDAIAQEAATHVGGFRLDGQLGPDTLDLSLTIDRR